MNKTTIKKALINFGTFGLLAGCAISTIRGGGYSALFAHEAELDVLYDTCIPESYHNK